jgi:hypothetical protein
MMKTTLALAVGIAALAGVLPQSAFSRVPPPPTPSAVVEAATGIANALEANNLLAYSRYLSDDLVVEIDGEIEASSKAAWLKDFGPKLSTYGVDYDVERIVSGPVNFIILSRYNSQGSFRDRRQECCEYYEVAKFEVEDGVVSRMTILRTGNTDLTQFSD